MRTLEENPAIPSTPGAAAAACPAEPRWSPWAALIMAWIRPATLARRTNHVPLWKAYFVHLTAVFLGTLLVGCLIAWSKADKLPWDVTAITLVLVDLAHHIVREYRNWPQDFYLWVFGTFLVIEGSALLTAFLAAGWAAADEPFRRSLAAGIRRTWLSTSLLLPAILFVGSTGNTLNYLSNDWQRSSRTQWPMPPQPPPDLQTGTPEWDAYQQQMVDYNRAWQAVLREYERAMPWYLRHAQTLIGMAFALALAWSIWTWLRGAAADRGLPPRDHPPLCEWCGYNLTHAPADGRCSECGRPVEESLGPGVRTGAPWGHRAVVGRWAAWRQCAWEAMIRPATFGRRLRLRTRVTAHGWYCATCIPLFMTCAWVGWFGFYVAIEKRSPFAADNQEVLGVFSMAAVFTTAFLVAVLCLGASFAGVLFASPDRRNLLPVAIQAAAYLCPFLVLWTLFAGSAAVAVVLLEPVYREISQGVGVGLLQLFSPTGLQRMSWVLANLGWLAVYFVLVAKVTSGARYANR